jgi:transposase-like protein
VYVAIGVTMDGERDVLVFGLAQPAVKERNSG